MSSFRLLWKGNWFIQEKSCKILAWIIRYSILLIIVLLKMYVTYSIIYLVGLALLSTCSARPKAGNGVNANGEASGSKKQITTIDDVLKGLVEWLCAQVSSTSLFLSFLFDFFRVYVALALVFKC